jgi:hypothetical protein
MLALAVLADGHLAGTGVRGHDLEEVSSGHHVVVQQQDAVVAGVVRLAHAEVEAARSPEVVLRRGDDERKIGPGIEDLARVVRARVVDHDDRVGRAGLRGEAVEHADEEVGAVEGHDDHGDGLGRIRRSDGLVDLPAHWRNLRWPEKSLRRPALMPSALSLIRCADGRVKA